jgi:hypothetical protein
VRWRQVVVLYVVLGGLAIAWWTGGGPPTPPAGEAPARRRFLPLGDARIREVTLQRRGRVVRARREGERWAVVEPSNAAVPSDLVAAFTEALARAEEIAQVADDARADVQPFGLDEGAVRVEVRPESGPAVVVRIGGTNPTGTAVYARREGTAGVVLIGRNVSYYVGLIFEALPPARRPAGDGDAPVGGLTPVDAVRNGVVDAARFSTALQRRNS